jgi:ABC-2 type transport system permease protein
MKRYARIYRVFFRTALNRELEFRVNFLMKLVMSGAWVFFFVVMLLVIFARTDTIAGWNRNQAMLLAATIFFIESILRGCFMSLHEIPTMVRLGTLDFVLTKPIDHQFWVSTRKFQFEQLGLMVVGIGMIVTALVLEGSRPGALDILGYVVLVVCAVILFYSFSLFLMSMGIFFVRVENLWVLGESVLDVARFPTDIYSMGMQRFFLFGLPLAFVATVPARQMLRGFDPWMVLGGIAWASVFFVGARSFWKFASKHYSSASS